MQSVALSFSKTTQLFHLYLIQFNVTCNQLIKKYLLVLFYEFHNQEIMLNTGIFD